MTMEEIELVTIANYLRPESLLDAYKLNQKKTNRVLGGDDVAETLFPAHTKCH